MIQGQVMGWIVVGGFAITLIVTILGMIQVVSIQKRYLNRLFALMIVELISAGFFLFYKEFNPPELVFDPPLQRPVYLFGNDGEPLKKTVLRLGEDEARVFDEIRKDELKDVVRKVELDMDNNALRFQTQDGTNLGFVENASALGDSLLPFEETFQLGMRYAECQTPGEQPCQNRRDSRQAVTYLLRALQVDDDTDKREDAVKQLFFLLGSLRGCEEFQQMATGVKKFRTPPHQYHELAETYLKFSQRVEAGTIEKLEAQKGSLKYYLAYLSAMGNKEFDDLIESSQGRARGLLNIIGKKVEYLQANFSGISEAIDSLDADSLTSHSDEIRFNFSCGN